MYVLSITVFYTKHLTPYTICVCLNSPPPPHYTAVPCYFSQLNKNIKVLCFIYRGNQSHCAAEHQCCCTVLTVG